MENRQMSGRQKGKSWKRMRQMPENPEVVEKYYLLFSGKVLKWDVFSYYHEGIPVYAVNCNLKISKL